MSRRFRTPVEPIENAGSHLNRNTASKSAQDVIHSIGHDYDFKLPKKFWMAALWAAAGIGGAIGLWWMNVPRISMTVLVVSLLHALPLLLGIAIVWGTRRLRLRIRDNMINMIPWRGDEQVLDVGTGSGITLIACAHRLTSGKATGIEVWDPNAGGGTSDIFWKNVYLEGVLARAELQNMDARAMTFANDSMDVIVSSFAAHHFGGKADRTQAAEEMARVLKPGGYVVIYDVVRALSDIEPVLRRAGFLQVAKKGRLIGYLFAQKPPVCSSCHPVDSHLPGTEMASSSLAGHGGIVTPMAASGSSPKARN
ncbi:MAG: class I SAM-dependent methyltransferase [Caldilineaceae bacterium]|nr:class I SAM-dependent methyltransferase [Caldilineaceae bacterium]